MTASNHNRCWRNWCGRCCYRRCWCGRCCCRRCYSCVGVGGICVRGVGVSVVSNDGVGAGSFCTDGVGVGGVVGVDVGVDGAGAGCVLAVGVSDAWTGDPNVSPPVGLWVKRSATDKFIVTVEGVRGYCLLHTKQMNILSYTT